MDDSPWDNTKAAPFVPDRAKALRSYDAAEAELESQGVTPKERDAFGKVFDKCREMLGE